MVIAVVDTGGNLMALQRMDQALLVSIDISIKKAYSSAAVKIPTHKLACPGKLSSSRRTWKRLTPVVGHQY